VSSPGAILIVDDEAHILSAIERLLRRDGYEVCKSQDGRQALDLLRQQPFAVLICDQRMPGLSGSEVLEEAYRISPDTVRISLTGYSDLETLRATVNQGRTSYALLKPWDDEHLRQVVAEAVRAYQMAQDHHQLLELTRRQNAELEDLSRNLAEQVRQRTEELREQNVQLQLLRQQLERSLRDTVGVLAGILEAVCPNIALHSKRVADLARSLGERLGLDGGALRDLEFAARLHDIGKAARRYQSEAAARHVQRPGQRETDHRHAESGYAILKRVCGFEQVAHAVRYQSEHYDGSGGPEFRKAEAIPLASRIIAVANAYDEAAFAADIQARYAPAAGRRALLEGSHRFFDPELVKLLLDGLETSSARTTEQAVVELSPQHVSPGMVLFSDLHNIDGLLVLRAGTQLTLDHIQHIRLMSDADPLLAGLLVRCEPQTLPGESTPADPSPAAASQGSATPAAAPPRAAGARGRVLVVDDDVLVRSALLRELRREGWSVVCAEDGRSAQNVLDENHFDLLLVDVAMPIMSGVALVAHVRQCWPDLPCIVLTGQATRAQVIRLSKELNVAAILAKPWDHDRLFAAINSVRAASDGCRSEPAKEQRDGGQDPARR